MDLFVYGTLRHKALRDAVAGPGGQVMDADLHGYAVHPLADHVVPLIDTAPAATARGLLWLDLSDAQAERIALYEGSFGYRLIDVTVAVGQEMRAAKMWLPPAHATAATGTWSLQHWEQHYAEASVLAAEELFATTPLPDPEDMTWQFPVMQKRAWNRVRARETPVPSDMRHTARRKHFATANPTRPAGRFFRLQGFDVTHRRFDGTTQGPLPREVFVGIDAVLVLPYDPANDRIVLVEQIRMGALHRGDPNPWILEPVAGMIDAFETPEQAALRETREESGLDVDLRHVTSSYPSPGNATDYFHCYVGLCDIPDLDRWSGGLASEHEDLRLHVVSLSRALDLVATGEISATPCVMLIYWLALNRDRLVLEFSDGSAR